MSISKQIFKQVERINRLLIESSFSIAFNYPSEKDGCITWADFKDLSFVLRKQPYADLYHECIKERAYNFLLIDGALVQIMYQCENNQIVRHRLAYYPNPNFERFGDSPNDYEENHFGSTLFSEILNRQIVAFPIRFDFDIDPKKYIEHDHAYGHMTLGNYSSCRIPILRPLSPNKFIRFILRSFYLEKYVKHFEVSDFDCTLTLASTLSNHESKYVYINT